MSYDEQDEVFGGLEKATDGSPVRHLPVRQWDPAGWTTWGRQVPDFDPLDFPLSWVTEEVSIALDRIVTGEVSKRRRTILLLADAVASNNREINAVIGRSDTISHSTWYQRMKPDPVVQEVYAVCLSTARHWYDQLEGQRLLQRAATVEQAQDNIVDLTRVAVRVLADMLGDPDTPPSVRRQLVADVFDRAGEETATKTTHVVRTTSGPSMRELANQAAREKPDRSVALGGMPTVEVGEGARLLIGEIELAGDLDGAEVIEAETADAETVEEDGTVGD
jgi:hypothetical protein